MTSRHAWQLEARVFAAEGLSIKSDYERSESKDLMVYPDKPQCMASVAKQTM